MVWVVLIIKMLTYHFLTYHDVRPGTSHDGDKEAKFMV